MPFPVWRGNEVTTSWHCDESLLNAIASTTLRMSICGQQLPVESFHLLKNIDISPDRSSTTPCRSSSVAWEAQVALALGGGGGAGGTRCGVGYLWPSMLLLCLSPSWEETLNNSTQYVPTNSTCCFVLTLRSKYAHTKNNQIKIFNTYIKHQQKTINQSKVFIPSTICT